MTRKQKDNQCTTSSKFKIMLIVFFFRHSGSCEGRLGSHWPDCQSAQLYWNLN